jgi:hypothetical protein
MRSRSGLRRRGNALVLAFSLFLGLGKPALAQGVRALQDRITDRGNVTMDTLEIADDVEMDGTGLDRFRAPVAQALKMALGCAALGFAHHCLFSEELPPQGKVARGKTLRASCELSTGCPSGPERGS